jgi:hypothetical protein
MQSVTMTVNTLDWLMHMFGFQQTSEVDHLVRGNKDDFLGFEICCCMAGVYLYSLKGPF